MKSWRKIFSSGPETSQEVKPLENLAGQTIRIISQDPENPNWWVGFIEKMGLKVNVRVGEAEKVDRDINETHTMREAEKEDLQETVMVKETERERAAMLIQAFYRRYSEAKKH